MTTHNILPCPNCHRPLPSARFNSSETFPCPTCKANVKAEVFPAFYKPTVPGKAGEELLVDHEASCFYHPNKKAVVHCENCGRFLCALCDVELNNQHLCPNCLEIGREKGKLKHLDTSRTLYDTVALNITLYPILLSFMVFPLLATIVTAPLAIVISIRHWNTPSSLLPRTKIRFILAILFSIIQIVGWIYGIIQLMLNW